MWCRGAQVVVISIETWRSCIDQRAKITANTTALQKHWRNRQTITPHKRYKTTTAATAPARASIRPRTAPSIE